MKHHLVENNHSVIPACSLINSLNNLNQGDFVLIGDWLDFDMPMHWTPIRVSNITSGMIIVDQEYPVSWGLRNFSKATGKELCIENLNGFPRSQLYLPTAERINELDKQDADWRQFMGDLI